MVNNSIYDKDFPLWNPGGRIPPDPVTGLTWKRNKNIVRPRYMNVIELDSQKKMKE